MGKMNGYSLDIVKENVEKLKEIFPEVFCENKIDFERLQEVLGEYIDDTDERYRFEWHGKSKAIRMAQTPSRGTLRPCKEESKNWNTTENLYIEGDNLEVLKLLQKSYQNKIKMIYIDPPYNTGNDFLYKDNYKDNLKNYFEVTGQVDDEGNKISTNSEAGGRYHTNWLNMMYPRLKLAKNLLCDDGVIFISIDDNEVESLKKICNEIFGEENFISLLSIENNPKGRKNSNFISVSNEYCLIYAKNKGLSYFVENVPKPASDMGKDENGNYVHNSGKRVLVGENKFNDKVSNFTSEKHYSVYYNAKINDVILKNEISLDEIDKKLIANGYIRYCSYFNNEFVLNTYSKSRFKELFKKGALDFKSDKIYEKNYNTSVRLKSLVVNKEYKAIVNNQEVNYKLDVKTTSAGDVLKEIFHDDKKVFPNSKNIGLIKLLITLFEKKDITILDLFSGSATTAHAVMKLNAEDTGNRKFVMVQLPEPTDEKSEAYKAGYKNICEIGKERIRRAGDKIVEENKDKEGIEDLDIGFKVFKLDSSNIKPWNPEFEDIADRLDEMVDNFVPGRTEEDVVYEIMLKYGIYLTYPIEARKVCGKKVFSVGYGALIICLDDEITLDVVNGIVDLKNELNPEICRVVFKDNGFKKDSVKVNAIEILKRNNINEVMSI
ncbi:site-specific DNA-methyltransferase [Clostridium autoethanogenum]|uniref:Site-specific DNA-methyltransferase n=1 Tax=Clostridium autoethanogenum TaxID=84023 RepID=A0A3M0ST41_9CLOT|nr:site-specific DNA-methyltransferase [Clostridium autoethanogenum]